MTNEIQYLEAQIEIHEQRIDWIFGDRDKKIAKEQEQIDGLLKRIKNLCQE